MARQHSIEAAPPDRGETSVIAQVKVIDDVTACTLKPQPNDCNMPTQHVSTLLGATCCAQQCCDICMLRWHVAIVWPGLYISECHTAFWLPSITPSKTSARMFREDRGVSKSIKRHLNSILDEDILSDCDSEEPIEES